MSRLYNALLLTAKGAINAGKHFPRIAPIGTKIQLFIKGQRQWRKDLASKLPPANGRATYWFHAASLGEFAVIRPVINRLAATLDVRVVLTFFSSTGCEALKNRADIVKADYIGYLPLDTPGNVRYFLDTIQPQRAIFAISEYWINYLHELRNRRIPTYLISALITSHAPFFKWWGKPYRDILECYTHIAVLTEQSRKLLMRLGYNNATVTGDPLLDNACVAAATQWHDEVIERFAAGKPLFIAGSISDEKDLALCVDVARTHPGIKCLFVPHEITSHDITPMESALPGLTARRSECTPQTDFSDKQVLIIDRIGELAYLYRYGTCAYIGGGFTPKLHSIIEATVYGLPTSFGPEIHRKATAQELIRLGIGSIVETPAQINNWIDRLLDNPEMRECIRKEALDYTRHNSGATEKITELITSAPAPNRES